MLEKLVTTLCEKLASRLEERIIYRDDGVPYLARYYIIHSDTFKYLPGVYLHKFLSSDEDVELHDHPWEQSFSFILTGGYLEQRRHKKMNDDVVLTHLLKPGSFNFIKGTTFHRIDLLKENAWTIFVSGDKKRDWGFWHPDTKKYTPWKEFVTSKYYSRLDAADE